MKILVTGVGSHVGAYLARSYAREGHQVVATYRAKKPGDFGALDGIRMVKVDLADGPWNLEPVDVVIHAAARTAWTTNPASEYIRSNVLGTQNLAAYGKLNQPRVIFYFSSIAVHGEINAAELCEDTPINRPDMYGSTKYMGEMIMEEHAEDFPSVTIRLPGVVGPGYFSPFIGRILRKAMANEPIPIYNPDSMFNAVTDFAEVRAFISHVSESGYTGYRAVNLAGSEPMRLRDIVETIVSLVGSRSSISQQQSSRGPFCINTERVTREFGFQPATTQAIVERYVNDNRIGLATAGGTV